MASMTQSSLFSDYVIFMPKHSFFTMRPQTSFISLRNRFLKTLFVAIVLMGISGHISCSSPKTVALSCRERQIEIFVDDQYLGRDLVYYTIPKGRQYIEVSCRENGVEVYGRRINVANRKGNLIEIQITKNYRYSIKPY